MPTIDRRPSDTPKSYAALLDYFAMGAGRSLRDLAALYRRQSVDGSSTAKPPTTRFETLGTWSAANDWQARCQAADDAERAADEAQRAQIRAQRRRELEDLDFNQGMDLRMRCAELLAEMPRFLRHTESEVRQNGELVKVITLALKAGPGELARAMKLASEIQRLSVGVATEHIEHSGEIQLTPVDYRAGLDALKPEDEQE